MSNTKSTVEDVNFTTDITGTGIYDFSEIRCGTYDGEQDSMNERKKHGQNYYHCYNEKFGIYLNMVLAIGFTNEGMNKANYKSPVGDDFKELLGQIYKDYSEAVSKLELIYFISALIKKITYLNTFSKERSIVSIIANHYHKFKTEVENTLENCVVAIFEIVIEAVDSIGFYLKDTTCQVNPPKIQENNEIVKLIEDRMRETLGLNEKRKIEVSFDINEEVMKLEENAILPTKGSEKSACYDLYSPIDETIPAHSNKLIKTNIAISWDNEDFYMQLLTRSGHAFKRNLVVQAGVIDIDYLKNIGVLLQNNSDVDIEIKRGERIAQYAYLRKASVTTKVVEEFSFKATDRDGGFGSTGK